MSKIKKFLVNSAAALVLLPTAKFASQGAAPVKPSGPLALPEPEKAFDVETQLRHAGLRMTRNANGDVQYAISPRGVNATTDLALMESMLSDWNEQRMADPGFVVNLKKAQELLSITLYPMFPTPGESLEAMASQSLSPEARERISHLLKVGEFEVERDAREFLNRATASPSMEETVNPLRPLRVVVSGYGAFMGITDNPSSRLAKRLAEMGLENAKIEYRSLDVTTEAVDAFVEEMKAVRPDIILSMGVGGQAQVEELPENHLGGGVPDGLEKMIKERAIREGAPKELPTDLPVDAIEAALQRFGTARVIGTNENDPHYAPDRSAYLCNYLGFKLADAFGPDEEVTAGFMHITNSTPEEQAHAVLRAIAARRREIMAATKPVPLA